MQHRWLTLVVVSVALFLVVIDMTVLYTALPTLARELATSTSEKLWILNTYSIVMAALMPVFGALGDRFGQRRIFTFGLASFGLASCLAAFTTEPWMLIAARALLGVGGAAMIPSTIAIVRLTFTDPKEQALAIGIWASIASGGAAVGPLLGGFLLEHFWWGSVFLINVPVVLAALLVSPYLLPNFPGHGREPVDFVSCLQAMITMVSFSLAIKEFANPAPDALVIASGLLLGAAFLYRFIKRQGRLSYPLVDLTILRTPAIAGGILVALIASLTLVGFELALSQRLQLVVEKSPLQAGLAILPISLGAFCAGPLAGWVIGRTGPVVVLLTGLGLTIVGILGYAYWREAFVVLQIISLACCGIGIGASLTASSSWIMSHVSAERAGMAGSLEGMAYEFGAALGVTLFGSLMSAWYLQAIKHSAFAAQAGSNLDQAHLYAAQHASGELLLSHAKAAFESSFSVVCVVAAIGLSILLGYLAKRHLRTTDA